MLHDYSTIIAIPLLILLSLYFISQTFHKLNSATKFLFFIYIACTASAIFINPIDWLPYLHESSYTAQVMLAYGALLAIALLPSLKLVEAPADHLPASPPAWLNAAMWIMIVGGVYAIVYQLPYALRSASLNSDELRVAMQNNQISVLPDSPATTIAIFFSTFYMQHIAMAFYSSVSGGSRIRTSLLWMTSIANVVSGAAFSTRDASVFYIFAVIFNYIYFRNSLSILSRRRILRVASIFSLLMAINVLVISVERFAGRAANDLALGTVGYFSSQPFTFAEAVSVHQNFYMGDLRFPVIKAIINEGTMPFVQRQYHYETMFGTFLTDIYMDGGWILLVIFTVLSSLFFFMNISRLKEYFFSTFIIQSLYLQFMFTGIFYFVLGSRQGNIYIFLIIALFMVSRIMERRIISARYEATRL